MQYALCWRNPQPDATWRSDEGFSQDDVLMDAVGRRYRFRLVQLNCQTARTSHEIRDSAGLHSSDSLFERSRSVSCALRTVSWSRWNREWAGGSGSQFQAF